jgi:hypothetical protein
MFARELLNAEPGAVKCIVAIPKDGIWRSSRPRPDPRTEKGTTGRLGFRHKQIERKGGDRQQKRSGPFRSPGHNRNRGQRRIIDKQFAEAIEEITLTSVEAVRATSAP